MQHEHRPNLTERSQNAAPPTASVPPGFVVRPGPGGREFLVPRFLAPAADLAFETWRSKNALHVEQGGGGPRAPSKKSSNLLGRNAEVAQPPDPVTTFPISSSRARLARLQGPTHREMLDGHAEVLALQQRLGISYADAAHRLYMAQVAKIHEQAEAVEAYAALRRGVETIIIEDIYEALSRIEDNEGGV